MRQALLVRWLLLTLLVACYAYETVGFIVVAPTTRFAGHHHLAAGFTLPDVHGNEIGKGSIVRVVAKGLKAYQVPVKGFGSFDDKGNFKPSPEEKERGLKNLRIPPGLVGVVTKVYDETDVSANLQIQVKFVPGADHVEKYDPPVAFLMHFSPNEVECVV